MPYPAWTAIGIAELITEGTLLEIALSPNANDWVKG
jgi:hypothetical protein